jgi:hypothetical protein
MSLFQAREWWRASSEGDELYDVCCLAVANIDNEASGDG